MKRGVLFFDAAYPPPMVGGKEKQAHLLAKYLVKLGCMVHVITLKLPGEQQPSILDGVIVTRLRKTVLTGIFLIIKLLLFRLKKNTIPIHTPSKIGLLTLFVSKILCYKIVFKLPNEKMVLRYSGFYRYLWHHLLKQAHVVVVLENNSYQQLINLGFSKKRVKKIYNGVEIAEVSGKVSVRKTYLEKRILFIGRLVEQKGCQDLLYALQKVRNEVPEVKWVLVIVGEGTLRKSLEKKTNELGLSDRVMFAGYQVEIGSWIDKSDLLVSPSYKEGMSNVILEAMSRGLAVIASDVGSNRELLDKEYLYQKGEIGSLKSLLIDILEDDQKRLSYAKALKVRCQNKFDIKKIAKEYLKIYKNIGSC